MSTNVLNSKTATRAVWAVVALFFAVLFLYANQSTIAARFNAAKPTGAETSALTHAPEATGLELSNPLLW
jgi:hypothetical protein